MTPQQDERLALAVENIASALLSIANTYELMYYKTFPPPRPPRDIEITRPPTEEERLRADQGATGEATTEDWTTLDEHQQEMGSYERSFVKEKKERTDTRGKGEVRARPTERRSEET